MDEPSKTTPLDWLRLVQTVSTCGRQLRKTLADVPARHGLSDTECLILWACGDTALAGRGQHVLASLVGISAAQTSGIVDRLGERGWLAGRRPLHDRRRQYWQLTPSGGALLAQVARELAEWSAALPDALLEAERLRLSGELERLSAAVAAPVVSRQEAA
jgi:DNA-binding MarR family transcriptional regulator